MLNIAYYIVAYVRGRNLFWGMDDWEKHEACNLWGGTVCMWYDMILNICWLQLGWQPVAVVQYTFTHKQYTEQQNENRIYRAEHT
jgi:hypothetical protein